MRKELQVIKYLLDNFSPSDGLIIDLRMANYLLAYSVSLSTRQFIGCQPKQDDFKEMVASLEGI